MENGNIVDSDYRITAVQRESRIVKINVGNVSVGDAENYIKLFVTKNRFNNRLRNRAVHNPKTEKEKNFFNSEFNYNFVV